MATRNKLTNASVKARIKDAIAVGKVLKVADGGGLYLLAQPSANEVGYWRYRYTSESGEQMLSLGTYPTVSLAEARDALDKMVDQRKKRIDPSQHRKSERAAQGKAAERERMVEEGIPLPETFAAVANSWYERKKPEWSLGHATRVKAALDKDLIPFIGSSRLEDLTPPVVLTALRAIERRGAAETAYRTLRKV